MFCFFCFSTFARLLEYWLFVFHLSFDFACLLRFKKKHSLSFYCRSEVMALTLPMKKVDFRGLSRLVSLNMCLRRHHCKCLWLLQLTGRHCCLVPQVVQIDANSSYSTNIAANQDLPNILKLIFQTNISNNFKPTYAVIDALHHLNVSGSLSKPTCVRRSMDLVTVCSFDGITAFSLELWTFRF